MNTDKPKKSTGGRVVFRMIRWGALAYLSGVLILMLMERTLVFPAPPAAFGDWKASRFGAVEQFVENGESTKIHVWTLKNPTAKSTLIFCHGNAETLGTLGPELANIRDQWNVNVVAFDFRGYGRTGGTANQANILSDAVKIGMWAKENKDFEGTKFIAFGRSIGGAPAIEMAASIQPEGLILDRTFSSAVDVAAARYPVFPVRLVMRNQFRSIEKLPSFQGALLQMHGDVDEVIPIRFARRLFGASTSSQKEFLFMEGLYHNDAWPAEFWIAGKNFVQQL